MKLNNKGFTFVEILAVIAIIGILSGISIVGVSKYREKAKNNDYEALAKSSYNAMEEYMMAHPYKKEASLKTLDDGDFLSNRIDPATKSSNCSGSVEVNSIDGTSGNMDSDTYTVYLCCTNYKKKYTYPDGNVEDYTGTDKCDVEEETSTPESIPEPTTDSKYTCVAGKYLPANKTSCELCTNGNYCPGGTWKISSEDQGLKPCPNGYKNSKTGSSKITQCYMKVKKNYYVKKANDKTSTKCPSGLLKDEHNVYYGKISSCSSKSLEVNFNCNGGKGGGLQRFYSDINNQRFGKTCTRVGHNQDGWKIDKSGKSKDFELASRVTENFILKHAPELTIYAHWNLASYKCNPGSYLKKSDTKCTKCPENYYCPGGTYKYNTKMNQGINKCSEKANNYDFSKAGSDKINDCYIKVPKDKFINKAKDLSPTTCPKGKYNDPHNVKYGKISSCGNEKITVTFNCNGGTGDGLQTFFSNKTGQKFSITCSRLGYTQEGWKDKKENKKIDYKIDSGVTENWILNHKPKTTVYAHWNINSYKCNAGYYLKKSGTSCTKCAANYYCPGGTYKFNITTDQGINKCSENAKGYEFSDAGSDKINDCYMKVAKNYYLKTAKDKKSTKCPSGQYKDAHNVKYGKVSSCATKTITVTFNCNAGKGGGNQKFTSDKTGQKFSKTCSRDGYHQNGWKESKKSKSKKYSTSSNVIESWIVSNSPKITLYAHWEPNECRVNFYPNGGKFKTNSDEKTQTFIYDDTDISLKDAKGGFYNAYKKNYTIDEDAAWKCTSSNCVDRYYSENEDLTAEEICNDIETKSKSTVSMLVNWDKTCTTKNPSGCPQRFICDNGFAGPKHNHGNTYYRKSASFDDSNIVGTLDFKTKIYILGSKNGFYKISKNKKIYYVKKECTKKISLLNDKYLKGSGDKRSSYGRGRCDFKCKQ